MYKKDRAVKPTVVIENPVINSPFAEPVRHFKFTDFTGAEEPYERLKRALRAEVDEAAWASLYATASRPFDAPTTGKIAIKVINHYGDEVLKVVKV